MSPKIVTLLIAALFAGCTSQTSPLAGAPGEASERRDEFIIEPVPSVSTSGIVTSSTASELFPGKPEGFTGLLLEARPDRPQADAPGVRERLEVIVRQEVVASTDEPDARGIYVLQIAPEQWSAGGLAVSFRASGGDVAAVSPSASVTVRTILFLNATPAWNLTQF